MVPNRAVPYHTVQLRTVPCCLFFRPVVVFPHHGVTIANCTTVLPHYGARGSIQVGDSRHGTTVLSSDKNRAVITRHPHQVLHIYGTLLSLLFIL